METTIPKIPAGISDSNCEFYEKNDDVCFMRHGQEHQFEELGIDYLNMLSRDLHKHPKALQAMTECGIVDWLAQLKRWAICNFGNFDNHADLTMDGVVVHEHVRCSYRGSCKYEGIICLPIEAPYGHITPRELQIIKLIAQDMLDKNIADLLGLSVATMNNHRSNIEHKIGCHSKAGITAFAYQKFLI